MKVTVENGENQQVTLTVEVEAAEVSKAVEKAVKRLSNRVNIPGFRKGKAPRKIIERNVGMDVVRISYSRLQLRRVRKLNSANTKA